MSRVYFIMIIVVNIYCLPFTDHLFNSIEDKFEGEGFSTETTYRDLYSYKDSNGRKHYLYQLNSNNILNYTYNNIKLKFEFNYLGDKIYFNDLSSVDDYLSFENGGVSFNGEASYRFAGSHFGIRGGLGYDDRLVGLIGGDYYMGDSRFSILSRLKHDSYRFRYSVNQFSDSFGFPHYRLENRLGFYSSEGEYQLDYHFLFPSDQDGDFDNRIYGNIFNFNSNHQWDHRFESRVDLSYSYIFGDFSYSGEQYGKIDGFQYIYYNMENIYSLNGSHKLLFGLKGLNSWIGEDSYIDIWPFTFWDLFLCSRTRLKQFDNSIILPHLGYSYSDSFNLFGFKLKPDLSIKYHHLFYENENLYKERYFIIFPILVGYRSKSLDIETDIDGLVDISLGSKLEIDQFTLELSVKQLLPFKTSYFTDMFETSGGGGGSPSSFSKSVRGGTEIGFSLIYQF